MLLELARAVRPDDYSRIHFPDSAAIRDEIARAVPFYDGIQNLSKQGDQFQWGGERLCSDRTFGLPDGKARFTPLKPENLGMPEPPHTFLIATRRGKQFNSMIQLDRDPLNGAERDHILIAPADAWSSRIAADDPILVRNEHGEFRGRAFLADVTPGTLQGHWPELLPLIPSGRVDPAGGVPDYNARVTLAKL